MGTAGTPASHMTTRPLELFLCKALQGHSSLKTVDAAAKANQLARSESQLQLRQRIPLTLSPVALSLQFVAPTSGH